MTTFPSTRYEIDAISTIEEYLDRSDWRVNANANQGYSLGGLILNSAGKMIANYWLERVYSPEAGVAHRNGDIHIHDLDMFAGYCAGWSLKRLIQEGFNGVSGAIASAPPKHFSSACGQIVNFLGTLQNEWAGAQAFSSFDTYMAPFVRLDNMTYDEILQCMQELIYNLNVPSRWGSQCPFTNLTFDWTCPDDLVDEHPLIGDEIVDFTYGELQKEMDLVNRAFIEVMTGGDADGRVFTFPIPTYNITPDFDWEGENVEALFEMTAKYGLPYFQNFINSDLDPHMIRSMCCRLQLDLRELLKRGNGLFGSAELTGSIGVVTINMARLGYRFAGDMEGLVKELDRLINVGSESLEAKRETIQYHMDHGLFPYSKRYLGHLNNHFSTIGVNGMNEMVRNFSGDAYDITDPAGFDMCCAILDHIRERMVELQEATGHMYNLEATSRRHDLPLRKGRPPALPGNPPGRNRGTALLHEFLAASRGLHRRSLPSFGRSGSPAGQVHGRHGLAPVHGRAHELGCGLQGNGASFTDRLQGPLHHHYPDLLDLPRARLPRWRTLHLREVRSRSSRARASRVRGLDPRYGLLPPREVLQYRQEG